MIYFDPLYFILLAPAMILAAWASWRLRSTYATASAMPAASGMSGAETARVILDAHNLQAVNVEPAQGFLGDHYDPRSKTLRLSPDVYEGRSVAALGIAAHEAGHAVQDQVGYAPLKLRNGIVPLAAIGSNLSFIIFFVGILLSQSMKLHDAGVALLLGGIGLFSLTVIMQVINLPVEYDASRRAKDLLKSSNLIAPGEEAAAMDRVLNAAALTYVAGTLSAIMTLLYLIVRSGLLRGNNR